MKVLKKLWHGITSAFSTTHPKVKKVYAVTGGAYLGEFFVYMEQQGNTLYFLSLPHMEVRDIPDHKFHFAIENNILDPTDTLPTEIYQICLEQYRKCRNRA